MKKVLVVDDDQYIRDVYRELLEGEKYQVETAVDRQEGLLKTQEGGFDLILLDVMDRAMRNGAKSYLIKSEMNPDQFLQNIKKFLG